MHSSLIQALCKLHLVTPRGVFRLLSSFFHDGITLMAILNFASKYYPDSTAIVSSDTKLNYSQFYSLSLKLSKILHEKYNIGKGKNVCIFSKNRLISALLLPAISRMGSNIKLLNTDIPPGKLHDVLSDRNVHLFIYEEAIFADKDDVRHLLDVTSINASISIKYVTCESLENEVMNRPESHSRNLPYVMRGGIISLYTSGSGGHFHETHRNTAINQFLHPFFALLTDVGIHHYDSIMIALPFYHGFGLASFIVSILMGKKVCLARGFDVDRILHLLQTEEVEVLPIVPAMLSRIWLHDSAEKYVKSLKCIISGADTLNRKLIHKTENICGKVLYNLYGTTEAGFFMISSPEDLNRFEEVTIGRPIKGVECQIRDVDEKGVGDLWVKSRWAMNGFRSKWQNTFDLVNRNDEGFFFHYGRADKMVVCGGENVYPEHVVSVLNSHPDIVDSVVYPVSDERFGLVLHAQVEVAQNSVLDYSSLHHWLKSRLTRSEMPHSISFGHVKLMSTGKKSFESVNI